MHQGCFVCCLQDVVDSLTGLLKSYSLQTDIASSASNTALPAAAASGTADASSHADVQQLNASEHAETAQQSSQASLHPEFTEAGDLTGNDQRVFGLIQHSDIEIQPVILSSLLACLPRKHVISDAMFADCENWFIQVAENLVLMGQTEEPCLAIPFIPYYLSMMCKSPSALFGSTQTRILLAGQMTDTRPQGQLALPCQVHCVHMTTSGHMVGGVHTCVQNSLAQRYQPVWAAGS